ncbi:MAG TPA: hypothetical protein VM241_02775 [Candidatus Thermoplasmatota archaeon]|nr:hypothetical protein [Candidatus Thermoplasmatota archaeon]
MTRSFPFATLATLILLVAAATPATGGAGTGVLPCDPNDAAPQVPILGTRVSPRIVGPGRVVASQHLVEATYECGQASVAGAGLAGQSDSDGDGMGDRWVGQWEAWTGQVLKAADDADQDGLRNSDEFRWELVPICFAIPARILQNCQDSEGDRSTGANGDGWRDGAEVSYWNDASNDFLRAEAGLALYDPDRLLDTDNDGRSNVNDTDSDNDGLRDGAEALAYDTYPELVDSDCAVLATACTPSSQTTYHGARSGSPGVGDGLNDSAELAFWEAMQPGSWAWDHDGDGIANALLDPDSDGDGLLDGEEFLLGRGQVRPDRADTDGDGVSDFNETAWSQDTDGDGLVNAADTDADGDGMPDGWEAHYGLNMVDPTDAGLDKDRDGLANLGEYQHATFPDNPDSEGDELQDGPEVAEGTNPFSHDSDSDGLPDAWEAKFKLHGGSIAANPVQADAGVDGDGDSFTAPWCGNAGHAFSNRAEYLHGIPDGWDSRPTQAGGDGVYWGGAQPNAVDTDGDGLADGYEVCSGLEPTTVDVLAGDDADADGLSNAAEGPAGTRYDAPDTDGDGLCDGGRAASCTSGNGDLAPGEANDYHTDGLRADTDGEGWLDGAEAAYWDPTGAGTVPDSDRDGRDNLHEADSDGDGISDLAEHESGTGADPSRADTDADGLTDKQELDGWQLSTWEPVTSDPRLADEDMDGLTDAQERDHQTDPRQADRDGDGLSDLVEVTGWGIVVNGVARNVTSNPNRQDTDWDLFSPEGGVLHDGQEFSLGTDPRVRDTDADGIVDGAEDQDRDGQAEEGEPSPVDNDTDDDGLLDGQEWNARMGDLHSDPLDADSDEDGVSDFAEVRTYGTDPLSHDTDNDFLPDGEEVGLAQAGGSPDKLTDPLDADTDDDGLPDGREAIFYGTDPRVADTDCDGQKDGSDPDPYNANVPPGEARPAAERACASAPTGNFGLRPADLPAPPVLASASAGAPADGDVGLLVFDQDGTVTLLARAPESETPITMVQAVIWLNGQLRTGADGTLSAGSGRITAELQTIDEPGAAPPSGSPYTHAVRVALPEGMVEAVSATYALTFVDANLNSATYTGGVDGFQLEEVGYADELNAADQQDYDDPSNSTLDGSGWSYVHANLTGQPRTDGPPGAQLAMGGGNVSDGLWIYRIVQPSVATLAGAIMDGKLVLVDASTVQVPVKAVLYTNTSVPVPKGDFGLYTQSSWWNSVAKAVKKVTQVASRVWGTVVTTATQAFNRAGQAVLGTTLAIYDEMRNPRSPAAYAARVAIDITSIWPFSKSCLTGNRRERVKWSEWRLLHNTP